MKDTRRMAFLHWKIDADLLFKIRQAIDPAGFFTSPCK
jgi:hypothetical protein